MSGAGAGTNSSKPPREGGPAIVLVRPQLAVNIGMCARAMANFGLTDLRLVSPREGWPRTGAYRKGAYAAAAGAVHLLEKAKLYDSVAAAVADLNYVYAATARERGLKAIIAGAGGAAHLPGMVAAKTIVPVLGVPVQSRALSGQDSLLSIVQMPKGVPVATFAIGEAGAANAALFAVAMLASEDPRLADKLSLFRSQQADAVMGLTLPPVEQD